MPLCLGAFGSVRTKVRRTSASWAPDVHTFCPLTTKSSPSRAARVLSEARSEPAPGSLIPSDDRHLGPQDGHRPPMLLLRGSERDQRRGDDADALRVSRQVGTPTCEF